MGFEGNTPPSGDKPDIIPDQFIVTLKPFLTSSEIDAHCARIRDLCSPAGITSTDDRVAPLSTFLTFGLGGSEGVSTASAEDSNPQDTLRGYSGVFTGELLETVQKSNEVTQPLQELELLTFTRTCVKVADIEPDRYVYPCVTIPLPEPRPPFNSYVWGLSRISHHKQFSAAPNEYVYSPSEIGDGVTAYVIDTGVRKDHPEFEGRASWGVCTVPGASQMDMNGHGTHVAGTIASKTYGVAKKAKIIDVKVYPDDSSSTSTSALIAGLDWAVSHALANNIIGKSVANISSGGGKSTAFNTAVAAAVRKGMIVVVAAGNEKSDALNGSPSSAPEAITVGATDIEDRLTGFSNWGRILDILAPGQGIMSTWHTNANPINVISGTSMASPHVAGLACCLRQNPAYPTAISVIQELRARAEGGISIHPQSYLGTPNLIAYNGSSA